MNTPLQPKEQKGQALIIAVLFSTIISVTIIAGLTLPLVRQIKASSDFRTSRGSYFLAEALNEDIIYRLKNGYGASGSQSLVLNGDTATAVVTDAGSDKQIVSTGDVFGAERTIKTVLSSNTVGSSFHYGVQVGDGGMTMGNNAQVVGNVYSNGSVSGGAVTGDVIVAGGITTDPQVEWTTDTANQFFATAASNRDAAQSFSTGSFSGSLNKVSLYLAKVGTPSNNLTVRITSDNGGKPATSDLASATISYSSVGTTASWIDVSFASPVTLSLNTKYWIVLDYGSNSATNYWNWRKDGANGYASNTGRTTSSWSSGSAVWADIGGDFEFRAWIGGTNNGISSMTIGDSTTGTGRANLFTSTSIHGSSCPNSYCIVDNPARQELPISNGVIQDWKDDAALGGVIAGNYSVSGTATLGPKKITGDLTVTNNAILIISGVLYVQGNVNLSNNCLVKLTPSYGANSGVIVADGTITVSNNCTFQGSGTVGSYVMVLSDKIDHVNPVVNISNNSAGVIYYASDGRMNFSNNASAKEATGYGIDLSNNSTVTYESGLANINFSSGPGGSFSVESWQEVE